MSTQQQETGHKVQEQQTRQQRKVAIGQHVMHTLGKPGDLHAVQVRKLVG